MEHLGANTILFSRPFINAPVDETVDYFDDYLFSSQTTDPSISESDAGPLSGFVVGEADRVRQRHHLLLHDHLGPVPGLQVRLLLSFVSLVTEETVLLLPSLNSNSCCFKTSC